MKKNRLYGIGEPVSRRVYEKDITADQAVSIMRDLGVTAFREWMGYIKEPSRPDYKEMCRCYDQVLDLCLKYDIEITGIGGFSLPADLDNPGRGIPKRDLSLGSDYRRVLEETEKNWELMVRRFPQIRQWETGNEWNFPLFMHPPGWTPDSEGYTLKEMMQIACDLMYVSARAIRRVDPSLTVVSFSPTTDALHHYLPEGVPIGFGISVALAEMYRVIENGESFSTNSDDFFDMVAWHPYLSTQMGYEPVMTEYPAKKGYLTEEAPDALWKSMNDMAYHVMARHGDGHKKVLLTEFGFSDCWNEEREKLQAALIPKCFELLRQMPYVKTCHFFRLLEEEDSNASDNGVFTNEAEAKFGIVREAAHGFSYRTKARILKQIYTGAEVVTQ